MGKKYFGEHKEVFGGIRLFNRIFDLKIAIK